MGLLVSAVMLHREKNIATVVYSGNASKCPVGGQTDRQKNQKVDIVSSFKKKTIFHIKKLRKNLNGKIVERK